MRKLQLEVVSIEEFQALLSEIAELKREIFKLKQRDVVPQHMNLTQAAKYMNRSVNTIKDIYVADGLPHEHTVTDGGWERWSFNKRDIDEYLFNRKTRK